VGTIDYGCYYKRGGKELKLHRYSDTDMGGDISPVQPAYDPYFSDCFFSRNNVFLSQKISQKSVSAYFSA
jgi:hypothetical protein